MRVAIVIDRVVDNVILLDALTAWELPAGSEAVALAEGQVCGIGWTYNGTTFAERVEP